MNFDHINKEYNETFHILVKNIKNINEIKSNALEENRFDILKAIAKYTSRFSDFLY